MSYKLSIFLSMLLLSYTADAQYKNIRVSHPESRNPEEVTIAINPTNPNLMAAGANIDYFYVSTDAGETWLEKNLASTLGVWGDPSVVYDNQGNLYFAHLSNPLRGYWIDRIVVQISNDNGNNWTNGTGIGLNSPSNQDKEWLAVDLTPSPYKNNIYVSWTEFDDYGSPNAEDSSRILFSKSNNYGVNWSEPLKVSDKGGNCIDSDETVEGAVPAIGPGGEIYISWAGPEGITFDRSFDGGQTFGKDIIVADMPGGWDFDVPGISRCNGMPITACDASNSPYRGNVYIMWSDQRNGTSNTDIFFVKSTDKGVNWSEPLRVNDDATERHQFFVWMAVDSATGNIYSVFYDRRNTTGTETEIYLARSVDGGDSFENYKISESSFVPTANIFFGDYTNIAAYKGKIYPIWMRMDDMDLSIWTALVNDNDLASTEEDEDSSVPADYVLNQNYPNPFNPSTTIGYSIAGYANVRISVFNSLGEELALLVNKYQSPGNYEVEFNADNLASGIYLYSIITEKYSSTRKMILLK